MMCDETDKRIKNIWEMLLEQEIAHLHASAENLRKYEGKEWNEVIPEAEFPELVTLTSNIEYVRKILKNTVENTALREGYVHINELDDGANFFKYQNKVQKDARGNASHRVIENHINQFGEDYRFEVRQNPVRELQSRTEDNYTLARTQTE